MSGKTSAADERPRVEPEQTSERPPVFRSLLKAEARDVLIFTGSNVLNKLGGVFLLPFYWRKLSPADYGILALISMVGSFQTLIGPLALDSSVTRFYYEWKEEDRRRNLGALWMWSWLGIAATTGLFLLVWPWLNPLVFPNVPYYPFFFLGICSNSLVNCFLIPAATIRIVRKPWLFASYNLISFLLTTGLGILYVLVLNKGVRGFLVAGIWSNLSMALFGAAVMLRFATPTLKSAGLRESMRFALPSIPSSALNTAGTFLDRFLLNYFTNTNTLGLYSIAMRIVDVIGVLHTSMKMAYGPFLMKTVAEDRRHGIETVARITPFYMLAYFTVGMLVSLFTPDLVHLVNRPAYFPIVQWVPPLIGVTILNNLYVYYTPGIILAKRTDLLWIPSIAYLGMLAPAAMLLIPRYQLLGLVATRYVAVAAFFLANLYLSQKLFSFPHRWMQLAWMWLLSIGFTALGMTLDAAPSRFVGMAGKAVVLATFLLVCAVVVLRVPLRDALRFWTLLGREPEERERSAS